MIYIARMLVMTFIEAFCLMMFMDTFLERREKCRSWIYVLLVILAWGFGIGNAYINIINIRFFVAILCFIIITHIGFQGKIWWKIFFSVLYYGVILMADGVVQLFVVTGKRVIINSTDIKYTVLMIFAKVFLFAIVLTIKLLFRRKRQYGSLSITKWLLYMIVPIMTIVIMLVFLTQEENMAMVVGTMILLGLNVVFIIMMNIILDREKKITEIMLMEENAQRQLSLYNVLEQAYSEQRKSTHEFIHHMDCIRGLLKDNEYDSAKEYVDKINGVIIDELNTLDTGNPIANTVLNQKVRYAKSKDISLIPIFNNLGQLKLEKDDIVVILSNLLDNAIEACERLMKSKKEIKLNIEDDGKHTMLTIKNPIEEKLNHKDGKLRTSKEDRLSHGIGLSNVESIVKKYNGECMYSTKDDYFTYTIHIEY